MKKALYFIRENFFLILTLMYFLCSFTYFFLHFYKDTIVFGAILALFISSLQTLFLFVFFDKIFGLIEDFKDNSPKIDSKNTVDTNTYFRGEDSDKEIRKKLQTGNYIEFYPNAIKHIDSLEDYHKRSLPEFEYVYKFGSKYGFNKKVGEMSTRELINTYKAIKDIINQEENIKRNEEKQRSLNEQRQNLETKKQNKLQENWNFIVKNHIICELNDINLKEIKTGVYLIRNVSDNNIYIGSTLDFIKRKRKHLYDLNRQKHHSYKLQSAFDKQGEEDFEFYVIFQFSNNDIPEHISGEKSITNYINSRLKSIEQSYIDSFKPLYNVSNYANGDKHWKDNPKYTGYRRYNSLGNR
jgi:hypothetical protein